MANEPEERWRPLTTGAEAVEPGRPRAPHHGPHPGVVGLGLLLVFAGLFAIGFVPYRSRQADLRASAEGVVAEVPEVQVFRPKPASATVEVVLPATVQAWQEVALFARSNGYVSRRLVDIGDRVTEGQLLAEIDTPELNEELKQARAALGQVKASLQQVKTNLELTRVNLERSKSLRTRGIVPPQDADEKQAAFDARQADVEAVQAGVAASQANVERLTNLQKFQKVVAPFSGIVTARTIDPGALVVAGSAGKELFRLAQAATLRVIVNVPQAQAAGVHTGMEATVRVPEMPGRVFTGTVARSTGVLDTTSRTLMIEVHLPNQDGALLPGMYVQVALQITRSSPPLMIPATALVVRSNGTFVASVTAGTKVHLARIDLGRDYGAQMEVVGGLTPGMDLIANPSGSIAEGETVRPVPAPEKKK